MTKQFDVIIIGGGATGAGVARDCSLRGICALLLERGDIATGATGRNHGLLHSGARYAVTDRESAEECIKENAHVALDQDEYQKRYDALVARFDKAKARHTEVTDLIAERMARKHQIEAYLKNLRSREPLTEFRETDWLAMVYYITVHSKKDIRVTVKDGTEIKA